MASSTASTTSLDGGFSTGRTSSNGEAVINRNVAPQAQVSTPPEDILRALDLYEASFLPDHPRSLSGIALRAFFLGIALTFSSVLTLYLLYIGHPLWRAPFFVSSLALFHFLEFWTTARTNTPGACIASFLLSSNGTAYAIAHTMSMTETFISYFFVPSLVSPSIHYIGLFLGLLFMLVGQGIRAKAMLTAGKSFSHIVAHTKKTTHALITTGVYSVFRHPSYFGYFWWAVGTQLVCGNSICLLGYVVVLFEFFRKRIANEEKLLVGFFGDEYVEYRAKTTVGIPFIK